MSFSWFDKILQSMYLLKDTLPGVRSHFTEHLSAQAKNPTVCAQVGGGTHLPTSSTIFPVEFMHTNCTIDRGHKT